MHRGLRDGRADDRRSSCGGSRCGRCSGWRAPGRTRTTVRARSASPSPPPEEQTLGNEQLNPFFAAAYEAAEEAVYNCLVAERPPMRKRDGREHPQFPRHLLARP